MRLKICRACVFLSSIHPTSNEPLEIVAEDEITATVPDDKKQQDRIFHYRHRQRDKTESCYSWCHYCVKEEKLGGGVRKQEGKFEKGLSTHTHTKEESLICVCESLSVLCYFGKV